MAFYQFKQHQDVNASIEEVWRFISSPKNLQEITPDHMGFDITSEVPEKMYAGMIVTYKVSPLLGIKLDWMTEITQVEEGKFFIDIQHVGPYKLWHHQHHIAPYKGGVRMTDIVTYMPPFGFIGAIANSLFIRRQLNDIFNYREKALNEKYGPFKPQ